MRASELHSDTAEILRNLSREFVQSTQDLLFEIERLIGSMRRGEGADQAFMEVRRHIHTIKGQGATFGFPTITRVAHMLEDYIETLGALDEHALDDLQVFVDRIARLLDNGEPETAEAVGALLDRLPSARTATFTDQIVKDVRALVVMPKSMQRSIIGRELLSCGFRLSFADDTIFGLNAAIAFPPRIVLASFEIPSFSGVELANVFRSVQSLRQAYYILLTSHAADDSRLRDLPHGTGIVHKGGDFAEQMVDYLVNWGFFGDVLSDRG
jgi:HPt (histidine-containing phosphotransfer) domain-containing protein/CheY-like chemotaxis protein